MESPEGTTTTVEGSDESAQTPKRGNTLFIWLSLIEAVEEITRFDYEKTLNMQAIEFFALATYAFYKVEKEKAEIEKFKQTKRY